MEESNACVGCMLAKKQLPVNVIYEDEYVTCILDIDPYNDGHTLILPKNHFLDVDEFDIKTANAVMDASILISKAIKEAYNTDGITICQNGGMFNELTHYHMHVVPRYMGQNFAEFYSNVEVSEKSDQYFARVAKEMKAALQVIYDKEWV